MNEVTRIINAIEQGDHQATEKLLPLVYEELRVLAAQKMAQEKPGQTLQATALVHEAYLRLVEGNFVLTQSEGIFMKENVAFYDLFRVHNGKIVEHWDTIEEIPAKENWKNDNGKF